MAPVEMPKAICWMTPWARLACSRSTASVAQVRLAHRLVPLQVVAGSRHRHLARLQNVRLGRRLEREAGVLLDQQHGQPLLLVDRFHDLEDLADDDGRQSKRWLVQEE